MAAVISSDQPPDLSTLTCLGHHTTPGRKTNVSSHLSPLHMLAAALPVFEYVLRERGQQSPAL